MRSGYVSVAHVDTDVNAYAEQPADLAHLVRRGTLTRTLTLTLTRTRTRTLTLTLTVTLAA